MGGNDEYELLTAAESRAVRPTGNATLRDSIRQVFVGTLARFNRVDNSAVRRLSRPQWC
jgi:hypothetical protein